MKILLVEDNEAIVKMLKMYLERLGHDLVIAYDGDEALSAFENYNFDLVITDYRMPKMDGFTLLKNLRKISRDVVVVLISADKNFEKNSDSVLANYVIKKPFSFNVIRSILEEMTCKKSQ